MERQSPLWNSNCQTTKEPRYRDDIPRKAFRAVLDLSQQPTNAGKDPENHSHRLSQIANRAMKQIISKRDAITLCHLLDLMSAVTIERGPRNGMREPIAPVECYCFSTMVDQQSTSSVCRWEADDERAKLIGSAWSVDMRLKFAGRRGIDLSNSRKLQGL